MGWFDEQIRLRKQSDQEVFEDSIFRMTSAVLGSRDAGDLSDSRIITKDAVDEVLKYYHIKPQPAPDVKLPPEEQLDYSLRQSGVMYRKAELTDKWYRDAFGPMIVYMKETGAPAAVLPGIAGGYKYISGGKEIRINARNAGIFGREALCFYRPLPAKKLKIHDLLRFMNDNFGANDAAMFLLTSFIAVIAEMLIPLITKLLTGFVVTTGSSNILLGTTIFLVCTALATQIIKASKQLSLDRAETKLSFSVESAVMMRLLNLPAGFFRGYSSGELSNRTRSLNTICTLILDSIFSTGITALISLLFVGQIFRLAEELVIPAVLVIAATFAVTLITAFTQMNISRRETKHEAKLSGLTYSLITGVQKIKMSGAEKRAFAKWAESYAEGTKLKYDPPMFIKINTAVTLAVTLIGNILIYTVAANSGVSPSDFLAFSAAFGVLAGAFADLARTASAAAEIRPILELAEPILEAEPETEGDKENITSLSGSIELNNVYFRYNDKTPYVINGLNLKVKAGEYIAVVGRTGCGKSTLIRLLLGFETPEKGSVFYDGKDISRIDLRSLRRKIGSVTQDGALFRGDIYSNIVISAPHLTLDEAWEAAETAGIADDIRAMPMGMHTVISEGHGGISGGQRQRIMIARAIAPKPKILLFDEATSALDNITQKKISDALDSLGCTRIVIAHRLSTIKNCDRILVLDDGRIAEDGTYDELISGNGLFAELVRRQRLESDLREF